MTQGGLSAICQVGKFRQEHNGLSFCQTTEIAAMQNYSDDNLLDSSMLLVVYAVMLDVHNNAHLIPIININYLHVLHVRQVFWKTDTVIGVYQV